MTTKTAGNGLCPIVNSIDIIGTKWKLIVIRYLVDSPMGFNLLLRKTGTNNSKELSLTLKQLQRDGIVERRIVSTQPFRVEYALTKKGEELRPVLDQLRVWGEKWAPPQRIQEPT